MNNKKGRSVVITMELNLQNMTHEGGGGNF